MEDVRMDLHKHTGVKSGVVPVQEGFGNFFPTEGKLPREGDKKLVALRVMEDLVKISEIKMNVVQVPVFPGTDQNDIDELLGGLKKMDFEPQLILMVTEGDPMHPVDETKVANVLWSGIQVAKRNAVKDVASTSLEQWMQDGATEKTGNDYDAAVEQLAALHFRVYKEQELDKGEIESWNIEFLRPGEMMTFTNLRKAWEVVKAMNAKVGKQFFKVLVDSAHCGDSGESISDTQSLLEEMIAAGDVNMIHASVATTRWHHASDEWMRAALISTAVKAGVKCVLDEVFNEKDPGLEKLVDAGLGFGVSTGLGLNSTQILAKNVEDTVRRILILKDRWLLPEEKAAA